jgi:hypothetical protein
MSQCSSAVYREVERIIVLAECKINVKNLRNVVLEVIYLGIAGNDASIHAYVRGFSFKLV